jgi:hypothetical protein
MSALMQKLREMNMAAAKEEEVEAKENLMTVPLEQLGSRKIRFGKVKLGQTIQEAVQDSEWTTFFVSRYENSKTPEHMEVVMFLSRLLSDTGTPIPIKTENKGDPKKEKTGKAKVEKPPQPHQRAASYKTKMQAPATQDPTSEVEWEEVMEPTMQDPTSEVEWRGFMSATEHQMETLTERMRGLEMALQEVVVHLRAMTPTQPEEK